MERLNGRLAIACHIIDSACGSDEETRREVSQLISAHDRDGRVPGHARLRCRSEITRKQYVRTCPKERASAITRLLAQSAQAAWEKFTWPKIPA